MPLTPPYSLLTRTAKGSQLTIDELDGNLLWLSTTMSGSINSITGSLGISGSNIEVVTSLFNLFSETLITGSVTINPNSIPNPISGSYTLDGSLIFNGDLTISSGSELIIPSGIALTLNGALINNGDLVNSGSYINLAPTSPYMTLSVLGNVSASGYYGDGSGLTGVTATATLPAGLVSSSLQFTSTDDVIFRNITASGNISASGNVFGDRIISQTYITAGSHLNVTNDINANGNIVGDGATNINGILNITASGNISSSGTVTAGAVTTTGNISSSAGYLYGERVFASRGFIDDLATNNLYGGDGANTAITLNTVAGLSLLGPVTASGNISSSGTVTALTGSFGTITGLSPITVTDSITFQQPITASIISASIFSGDGSGLTNVPENTDIDVYLNFEEATSFAYIVPYNLQFAGFVTSSAMIVQISSSGAPYVFTSSLSQFSTLSVTSSAAGLVILSGSKL